MVVYDGSHRAICRVLVDGRNKEERRNLGQNGRKRLERVKSTWKKTYRKRKDSEEDNEERHNSKVVTHHHSHVNLVCKIF